MNKPEFATAKVLTSVWVARPFPIDEKRDDIDTHPAKTIPGQAFLKVVAYPWGVEFDLCEAEEKR